MKDKTETLKRYFETITREEGSLEGLSEEASVAERIAKTKVLDATPEEIENAQRAVRKLARGEELAPPESDALEAIVLPAERPVVDIVNDSFGDVEEPFTHLGAGAARQHIEAAIPSVGRIGVPDHPDLPFAGTGFVVGDGLLMTNRHVAGLFARGVGREGLSFEYGQTADVDFKAEIGGGRAQPFRTTKIVMIHPYWDMALLEVEGLRAPPLRFLLEDPRDLEGREVAVIGYPAFDHRNDPQLQLRIFRRVFNVKRLQPGRLRRRAAVQSFGNRVSAVTHDSSTLGGNSGSAVLDVETGRVVALHFAGRYLEANFAVPVRELARDRRVVEARVNFEGATPPVTTPWDRQWRQADPGKSEDPAAVSPARASSTSPTNGFPAIVPADHSVTWSLPLEITVRLGTGSASVTAGQEPGALGAGSDLEKMVEPFHDDDYTERQGYNERFLGTRVPLPRVLDLSVVSKLDDGSHAIPYEHFSIVMHKKRRIAVFAASNVDGRPEARRPDPTRRYTRGGLSGLGKNDQEKWFTDPRIAALHQLPDRFFNKDRASFDKGHLVRRDAVAWGEDYDEVRRANGDSYHVTNCSPQVKGFNRSNLGGLWGKLENLVLDQAEADGEVYSVFAGPVLDDGDPAFSGFDDNGRVRVSIPRRFWKVVVARRGAQLESFGFLLDQDLTGVDFEFAVNAEWRARLISIPDLEAEIGLVRFPRKIHDSDQADAEDGERVRAAAGMERFHAEEEPCRDPEPTPTH